MRPILFIRILYCALAVIFACGIAIVGHEAESKAAHCGPKCRAAKAKSTRKKAAHCGPKCRAANARAEGRYCGPRCRARKRALLRKIPLNKIKGRKGKKGRAKLVGVSKTCPFGTGHKAMYCPSLEPLIRKTIGGDVRCWSNLFGVESAGTCSTTVYHDPKKAHNPYAGIGLCAIEQSPAIRDQNRRGPACKNIKGFENQFRCCKSMMQKTNAAYFGSVKCGHVPHCH
jgi:hypothetical protein